MGHLGFASVSLLCALLLAASLVFFIMRVRSSASSCSWRDVLLGLLGYGTQQDDLQQYWLAGAGLWFAAAIIRTWFYVSKESSFWHSREAQNDEAEKRRMDRSLSRSQPWNSEGQDESLWSKLEKREQRAKQEVFETARRDAVRLLW